jgi:heme o synthase
MLVYSEALVALSIASYAGASFGLVYFAATLALGLPLVALVIRLHGPTTAGNASALFRYSILYLPLLFAAAALDQVIA